jgi:hypothetical protein
LNQGYEAHYVLSLVGQLSDIEDEVRLQSPEARLAARRERSVPILDRLEKRRVASAVACAARLPSGPWAYLVASSTKSNRPSA